MLNTIENSKQRVVFLYDGDCGFCDTTVMFLLSKSFEGTLYFAPLQSDFAKKLFKENGLASPDFKAAYLWDGNMYKASDAVLRAFKYTKSPYKWFNKLLWMPPFIRNGVYYTVARFRKKLPFYSDSCRLLTATERQRFI